MVRAAAVQLTGGDDVDANLKRTGELLTEAAADGCTLAVLPENFPLMPRRSRDKARIAERPGDGPIQDFLRDAAARHGLWIVGGSMPLASPDAERVYGACPVVSDAGEIVDVYRKIHLFDVALPDSDESYRESYSMYPGDEPCVVDNGNPGRIVPPVLQRMQSGHQDPGDVAVRARCHDAAHQAWSFSGRFQPGIVTCFARLTVSLPAGASLVMVEPAPMFAFSPTETGAISCVSEPMKAPSPITVRCLLAPS